MQKHKIKTVIKVDRLSHRHGVSRWPGTLDLVSLSVGKRQSMCLEDNQFRPYRRLMSGGSRLLSAETSQIDACHCRGSVVQLALGHFDSLPSRGTDFTSTLTPFHPDLRSDAWEYRWRVAECNDDKQSFADPTNNLFRNTGNDTK
jgi:hypothetical protein